MPWYWGWVQSSLCVEVKSGSSRWLIFLRKLDFPPTPRFSVAAGLLGFQGLSRPVEGRQRHINHTLLYKPSALWSPTQDPTHTHSLTHIHTCISNVQAIAVDWSPVGCLNLRCLYLLIFLCHNLEHISFHRESPSELSGRTATILD